MVAPSPMPEEAFKNSARLSLLFVNDEHLDFSKKALLLWQIRGRELLLSCAIRTVKWNLDPTATSLSTQMRPPIISTSRRDMVRPKASSAELLACGMYQLG